MPDDFGGNPTWNSLLRKIQIMWLENVMITWYISVCGGKHFFCVSAKNKQCHQRNDICTTRVLCKSLHMCIVCVMSATKHRICAKRALCKSLRRCIVCVYWRELVMSATKQRNYDKYGDDQLLMIIILIMMDVTVIMTLMMILMAPPPQRSKGIAATWGRVLQALLGRN